MSATDDLIAATRLSRRDFVSTSISAVSTLGLDACRSLRTNKPTLDVPSAPGDVSRAIEVLTRSIPRTMARQDIPGLSIALVQHGAVVWMEGFGFTDRERRTAVRSDTQFSVGSISKSFTTLGVLRAVEQGKLSLDEPLQTYLSWFTVRGELGRSAASKITLRHLLSHHAGLGTWAPLGNPYDPEYHARTFDEVVRSSRDSRLKFAPGERFEYSNQGIDLAGAALATVRGKSFVRCMQDDVLDPLGMSASTFDQGAATTRPAYAPPHTGRRRVPVKNGIVHPMLAAGGMISTAPDLARFLALHRDEGRIGGQSWIQTALLREVYTPQFSAREQPTGYGLAMYKAIEHDAVRFSHGGVGFGVSAHYRWLPEHDFGVVVLTNQDAAHNAPAIASEAVVLMLGRGARGATSRRTNQESNSPAVASSSSSGALPRAFAGSYVLYEGILETFEADRERLYHVRGRQRTPLLAIGAGEFLGDGRRYTFTSDAVGRVQGVRILDVGYDVATTENSVLYLARNDAPTDAPGPNRAEWVSLTGRYTGTFVGAPTMAELGIKNGCLYLNGALKLSAVEPGRFVTADNEEVRVDGKELFVGNRRYVR
jgi:CubicO group peptidase (beta-lactamase class C family)